MKFAVYAVFAVLILLPFPAFPVHALPVHPHASPPPVSALSFSPSLPSFNSSPPPVHPYVPQYFDYPQSHAASPPPATQPLNSFWSYSGGAYFFGQGVYAYPFPAGYTFSIVNSTDIYPGDNSTESTYIFDNYPTQSILHYFKVYSVPPWELNYHFTPPQNESAEASGPHFQSNAFVKARGPGGYSLYWLQFFQEADHFGIANVTENGTVSHVPAVMWTPGLGAELWSAVNYTFYRNFSATSGTWINGVLNNTIDIFLALDPSMPVSGVSYTNITSVDNMTAANFTVIVRAWQLVGAKMITNAPANGITVNATGIAPVVIQSYNTVIFSNSSEPAYFLQQGAAFGFGGAQSNEPNFFVLNVSYATLYKTRWGYLPPLVAHTGSLSTAEGTYGYAEVFVMDSRTNPFGLPAYYPYTIPVQDENVSQNSWEWYNISAGTVYFPRVPVGEVFPFNATVTVYSPLTHQYLPVNRSGGEFMVNASELLNRTADTPYGLYIYGFPFRNFSSLALIGPFIINASAPGFVSQSLFVSNASVPRSLSMIIPLRIMLKPVSGNAFYGYVRLPYLLNTLQRVSWRFTYQVSGNVNTTIITPYYPEAVSPQLQFFGTTYSSFENTGENYTQYPIAGVYTPYISLLYDFFHYGSIYPFEAFSDSKFIVLNITAPGLRGDMVYLTREWNDIYVTGPFYYPITIYNSTGMRFTLYVNDSLYSSGHSSYTLWFPLPDLWGNDSLWDTALSQLGYLSDNPWVQNYSKILYTVSLKAFMSRYHYNLTENITVFNPITFPFSYDSSSYNGSYVPQYQSRNFFIPSIPFSPRYRNGTVDFLDALSHPFKIATANDRYGPYQDVNPTSNNYSMQLYPGRYLVVYGNGYFGSFNVTALNTTYFNVSSVYQSLLPPPSPYGFAEGYFLANYTYDNRVYPVNDGTVEVYYGSTLLAKANTTADGFYYCNVSIAFTNTSYNQWPHSHLRVKFVFTIPYGQSYTEYATLTEFRVTWVNETARFNGSFTVGNIVFTIPSWLLPVLAAALGIGILLIAVWIIIYVASIMAAVGGGIFLFLRVTSIIARRLGQGLNNRRQR